MNIHSSLPTRAAIRKSYAAVRNTKILITVLIFAAIGGGYALYVTLAATPSSAPPPTSANCGKAQGPFKDSGTSVLQANGKSYIPYGFTVPGLGNGSDSSQTIASDEHQMQASASYWCSNTVRLQISQDSLVGANGTTYSSTFMNAIKAEVAYGEKLGLVVVINAQTQDVGKEPLPTSATLAFWKTLTGVYGNDPQVVFDLFNEPRTSIGGGTSADSWKIWQNGGVVQGVTYYGMQQLSSDVRSYGSKNLIWIEGPGTATTLSQVSAYPIRGIGPMSYAIHHPTGAHNTAVWQSDFGYLITKHIAPVVDGEWTQYASATKSECWDDAYTTAPVFLNYLQGLHVGMTVWSLREGVMLGTSSLTDPTSMSSNYACVDNINGANAPNEGGGNLIRNWYIANNESSSSSNPPPSPGIHPSSSANSATASGSTAPGSAPNSGPSSKNGESAGANSSSSNSSSTSNTVVAGQNSQPAHGKLMHAKPVAYVGFSVLGILLVVVCVRFWLCRRHSHYRGPSDPDIMPKL